MTPLVAEVLRMVSERGRPGEFVGVLACLPALIEAGEAGLLEIVRNDWGAIESMILTAAGTEALNAANVWLEIAARSGYEAGRAVVEEKTQGAVVVPSWDEARVAARVLCREAARSVLAGRGMKPCDLPQGYGAEAAFVRVVVAAFGEGE